MTDKKLQEMRKKVKSELEHISRGNLDQNMMRAAYWSLRMHSLGKRAKGVMSKEEVLTKVIESVKKDNPNFVPVCDGGFFELNVCKVRRDK